MLEEKEDPKIQPEEENQMEEKKEFIGPMYCPMDLTPPAEAQEEERFYLTPPNDLKVKLFVINEDGNWSDCGVGTLVFLSRYELVVCNDNMQGDEPDFIENERKLKLRGGHSIETEDLFGKSRGDLLLKVDLKEGKEYLKTQTTILSWEQRNIEENIALSFVYSHDCFAVWKYICTVLDLSPDENEQFTLSKDDIDSIIEYLGMDFTSEKQSLNYLFDKAVEMFNTAEMENDWTTLMKLSQLVESLILCTNADLSLKMFGDTLWRFTFGALEYHINNFDSETQVKKHSYRDFLDKQTKMMIVDKTTMNENFEELVKLKFRVQFYSDFVNDNVAFEILSAHFQMLNGTLNVHLLDYLLTEDFIVKTLYPEDGAAKMLVGGFASEFFAMYKSQPHQVKMDISCSFREKNVGYQAIRRLYELLKEAMKKDGNSAELSASEEDSQVLKIQLSSANVKTMEETWDQKMKNLILAQLEILYITCRKDKEYSYELFREFEHTEELMELLVEFPDDSSFDVFMELLFPTADPFSVPQNLLISFLGLKTIKSLGEALETRVMEARRNGQYVDQSEEKTAEQQKTEIRMLYKYLMFLCICMKSLTPAICSVLQEMKIGEKLTFLLEEIDNKLIVKKLHFVLIKYFTQLVSECKNMNASNLYPDCGFFMLIYQKYRFKNNLINSQTRLQLKNLGSMWTENLVKFVKNNWEYIQSVKDSDENISTLLKNVIDSNGNLIETREDFTFSNLPGSPKDSIMKFGGVNEFYQMMNTSSPDKDKVLSAVSLGDYDFKYLEENQGDGLDAPSFNGQNLELQVGEDDMGNCFTSAPSNEQSELPTNSSAQNGRNEEGNNFEDEEESEAQETLKGLLASLRKKKNNEEDSEEDIRSYLSQNDDEDDFMTPLNAPRQLAFQFNAPIEDDEDDDVLLPAIKSGYQMRPKSLNIDISLGKRADMDMDEEEDVNKDTQGDNLANGEIDDNHNPETQSLNTSSKHLKI